MTDGRIKGRDRAGEGGFALVLAILSLMLLTFLGLTLATTTSTELQIATNYRWSQMALYNAEAGLEAARIVLADAADATTGWQDMLPVQRVGPYTGGYWDDTSPTSAPEPTAPSVTCATPPCRDFELKGCDTRGNIGYGIILDDRVVTGGLTRLENTSTFMGQSLNGAFTVWIRRNLIVNDDGQYTDSDDNNELVIVSEGVAPYVGASTAFTRARQAVRVLETRYALLSTTVSTPCEGGSGQEGGTQTGDNFNPCAAITSGAGGSLEAAFGGAGAGLLTGTGAQ
ncbi:MAG: pilus assembly PilX N-terminal domain-containing protein [Acidobacteria bacterium]|jgi:hypothetical protein|nr:pilus assembly PilX N-terminal domain-containing protein [Acidobacteriota bacterium]